ncbi:MAG TPA: ATP-binding cassette domain-containing protein, partial [Gaiellaceae bacterium]|nr:ATP-binding cassette domain-containing protein [Gaiellaceae bacterium]
NGFHAVKDLSLEIQEGELLVLVGPSGCGKTTALRMIAGLEDITSGDLYIGGHRVNDVLERDRDIAMVFQSYALYPHMTVAQNIGFTLKVSRRPKAEIRERVHETAKLLGLEQLLDRRPKQLSGGQRQRVAMGRAIIRQPQVFLMDEPLSNLDANLRVHMRGEIDALQKRLGVTTVYVTHDQVEAMTMGDRVAVLSAGELQQVDTPREIYDHPVNLFVASFIGSPPMNLAVGSFEAADGGVGVRLGDTVLPLPPEHGLGERLGTPVIVGIRPEDLSDATGHDAPPGPTIRSSIERVEALGATLLAFFRVDAEAPESEGIVAAASGESLDEAPIAGKGTLFCAAFEPRSMLRPGDVVDVAVNVAHIHLFDPETEQALGTEARAQPAAAGAA